MIFIKVIIPIIVFDADPVSAVAAFKVCYVFAANKTEFTIVAYSFTLRAIFLTAWADRCALLTGRAALTDHNALITQITVIAESPRAFAAVFAASFTNNCLIRAFLAAWAVVALGDGTIHAKFICGTNIGTSCANTAFDAEFATVIAT